MDQSTASFDPSRFTADRFTAADVEFIATLVRHQAASGKGDRDFAASIGVSRVLWCHTKIGRARLGFKLLRAAEDIVPQRVYAAAQASVMERASSRIGRQPKGKKVA